MNRVSLRRRPTAPERRGIVDLLGVEAFTAGGMTYFGQPQFSMRPQKVDVPDSTFDALVGYVHDSHGVIAAAVAARAMLLSQLRFQWRSLVSADNGRLFGSSELGVLEHPNMEQTRAELLSLAEYHVSYAGSAFFHRDGNDIRLLHPSWVSIVLGSNLEPDAGEFARDARVVGYVYKPGGPGSNIDPTFFPATEVAHWRPEPDPKAFWRGKSWVSSILTEWTVDKAAWTHTQAFFENAATPQMVYTLDPNVTKAQMAEFADVINDQHAGASQAYKSLVIGGGADAKVVGSDLSRIDLKTLQGLTETRIAVRARIPAAILGISEGLQGSALNGSSYNQTRRTWADTWFSPTAQGLCAALERIVPPLTSASELSYDPAAILFLQDDRLDESAIQQQTALTIRQLIDAGFDPSSVVSAVTAGDFRSLVHSGLYSVQLQPAGSQPELTSPDQQNSVDLDDLELRFMRAVATVPTPPAAAPIVPPQAVNVFNTTDSGREFAEEVAELLTPEPDARLDVIPDLWQFTASLEEPLVTLTEQTADLVDRTAGIEEALAAPTIDERRFERNDAGLLIGIVEVMSDGTNRRRLVSRDPGGFALGLGPSEDC